MTVPDLIGNRSADSGKRSSQLSELSEKDISRLYAGLQ